MSSGRKCSTDGAVVDAQMHIYHFFWQKKLLPDQLVLLLELLFAVKSLSSRTLQWLQKHYCLREQDAEVRHRWCELVIKHKHTVAYGDLLIFLEQDQAMGVYLYGELMVNEDAKQQQLVHSQFKTKQQDYAGLKIINAGLFKYWQLLRELASIANLHSC
ncbi:hypothetical protein scyTo_0007451 [Scyliorhinus torazame]|uniref:Peptidase M1 leukotriene A4 hydrolase/aminopeptidase C-terminal domain-containing protein n=1 Tax=Scyliorhinus torazame TaxID=75743 RepID=A0A401NSH2_SCYTO|nr:hypothetical protein [Scyliorhinus torazame]